MSVTQPAAQRTSGMGDDQRSKDAFVVIIDDDQEDGRILQDLVTSWGMRSRCYTEPPSGSDGVELDSADVFLVDVLMPGVNGLDLIPAISELVPVAGIVIITGCADKATAIKALRLGAFDFMEKPVQAELLYHSIRSAIEARTKDRNLEELINELEQSQ